MNYTPEQIASIWGDWYNEMGSKGILGNLRISSIEQEVREWDAVRDQKS